MRKSPVRVVLSAAAAVCIVAPASPAAPRTSQNYAVSAETIDTGGARVQSANYRVDASLAALGGISSAAGIDTVKHGYAGQLYDPVALRVSAPSSDALNENTSRQLEAVPVADDTTTLPALNPSLVQWSVLSGPVAISTSGVATAATVYADRPAAISGTANGLSGQWNLTVLNVGLDDYGSYAGDGIDDAWQVNYFGENNSNAAPAADPDGDGQHNLFEFTAGLAPDDPNSLFRLRIDNVAGQPGHRRLIFSPRLADRTYVPQFRASLTSGEWAPLPGTIETENGTERTITDPNATGAAKFYRIDITKP